MTGQCLQKGTPVFDQPQIAADIKTFAVAGTAALGRTTCALQHNAALDIQSILSRLVASPGLTFRSTLSSTPLLSKFQRPEQTLVVGSRIPTSYPFIASTRTGICRASPCLRFDPWPQGTRLQPLTLPLAARVKIEDAVSVSVVRGSSRESTPAARTAHSRQVSTPICLPACRCLPLSLLQCCRIFFWL